jgi:hypothetical protein
LTTASTSAIFEFVLALLRLAFEKLALPMPAWMMPAFSTRNSTGRPWRLDGCGDVHGHGAELRVRHQAARAEHLAETADQRPSCPAWRCSDRSRSCRPDGFDQVFGADDVGAGGLGFVGLGAAGEHGDAHVRPVPFGSVDDAADHLVGVARIDAEVHRDLDGLVELGGALP